MAKSKKESEKPEVIKDSSHLNIEDVEHEEVMGLTVAQRAKSEVAKFNVARKWISDRKSKYLKLKIASPDDKEGQAIVKAAWQEIRNKRLAVGKKHTELKKDYLEITRAIDGEKNELTRLLEEIEDPLKNELDRIEMEKERARVEEEGRIEAELQMRVNKLIENGVSFNGSYYSIGDVISIDVVTLKAMKEDDYNALVGRVKVIHEKALADLAEKARLEQEERDRVEQQRKDNEAKQAELEAQQKAFREQQEAHAQQVKEQQEAIEAEKKRILDQRTRARSQALESKGMIFNYNDRAWRFSTKDIKPILISPYTVETADDDQWDIEFKKLSLTIDSMKEDQQAIDVKRSQDAEIEQQRLEHDRRVRYEEEQEKKAKENRFNSRVADLRIKFSMVLNGDYYEYISPFGNGKLVSNVQGLYEVDEQVYAEHIQLLIDHQKELSRLDELSRAEAEAQAEANRQAALSDMEKVNDYLVLMSETLNKCPKVESPALSKVMQEFVFTITNAVDVLATSLSEL